MSVVIFFVEKEQTAVLERRAAEHGVVVANMVAQLSENRLMYYDLVALQQNMEYAAEDEDRDGERLVSHERNPLRR